MTDTERRAAAKQFAADWQGRGDEKQETQRFWIELLTKVFGIDGSTAIAFEVPVKLDHKGNHMVASNFGRESPMASDFPSLTFSTSVCLDRASEIRYNILRRMRERKVLVTAIHDFPTGEGQPIHRA